MQGCLYIDVYIYTHTHLFVCLFAVAETNKIKKKKSFISHLNQILGIPNQYLDLGPRLYQSFLYRSFQRLTP